MGSRCASGTGVHTAAADGDPAAGAADCGARGTPQPAFPKLLPPSSDPPSAPPRLAKAPRGKPNTKGAQPDHLDQQHDLLPEAQVQQIVLVWPTGCPQCLEALPAISVRSAYPNVSRLGRRRRCAPVTEDLYQTVCCPGCGDLVTATRPDGVSLGAFARGQWR
ncbi:MAG: hypothetical protein MI924_26530 [Chloroflexales bacterium]|nr:hypothetical protein [Chloroflexales bacterium]